VGYKGSRGKRGGKGGDGEDAWDFDWGLRKEGGAGDCLGGLRVSRGSRTGVGERSVQERPFWWCGVGAKKRGGLRLVL